MKIDIKSALFGLAFGVLIMLVIAAVAPPATVGRYQIAGTASHGLVQSPTDGTFEFASLTSRALNAKAPMPWRHRSLPVCDVTCLVVP